MNTDDNLLASLSAGQGGETTAREIAQQPEVWRETEQVVASRREDVDAFLRPLMDRPDLRIILTGAGTSAFAGEILAPALSRRTGRRVDAVATTDIVSSPKEYFANDGPTLLVSFARSGNSPESVAATELADRLLPRCHHLILTCDRDGRLYEKHADEEGSFVLLMPEATNDQGFAMTSSFTSMMLAAWVILGRVEDPGELAGRLATAAEKLLDAREEDLRTLASSGYQRVVFLGSGPLRGLAHESSLKLLELTAGGIVTYFESPLGFRHGPKSILDDRTLAVLYVSGDEHTRKYDLDLLEELKNSMPSENVVAVSAQEPGAEDPGFWLVEGVDGVDDAMLALPFVLVAQLLGIFFSLELGYTPDNPFPNQEVNRVVQGVSIHPIEEGSS
ncbi:MAG TPA: SIS domain-containing protein [Rubrobacter sp.]|nr:SIS domain-containing protein [Rubrobacter sp.]